MAQDLLKKCLQYNKVIIYLLFIMPCRNLFGVYFHIVIKERMLCFSRVLDPTNAP